MDLYNLGTHNGVTAVLTGDAWIALYEALTRKSFAESKLREVLARGYTLDLSAVHPLLVERITRGTMTFVEATRWRESDLNRTLHTGTRTELEDLGCTHTIDVIPDFPFTVPFSSGHIPTYQRELELGFGPKPTLLAKLKEPQLIG